MDKKRQRIRDDDEGEVRRTLLAVRAKFRAALALSLARRGGG